MRRIAFILATLSVALLSSAPAFAHCEMPCGIYHDQMRFDMMAESVATIEKAIGRVTELQKQDDPNYNQIVRWINTKEEHASGIQEIVSQYFLTQRIKADQEKYAEHLQMCHALLTLSMKCKQSLDPGNVTKLKSALEAFRASYLGPEGEAHQH